jgi:hypothetical protein
VPSTTSNVDACCIVGVLRSQEEGSAILSDNVRDMRWTGDRGDRYGGRSAAGRAQLGVCSLAAGQWKGGVGSAAAGRQQRGQAAGRRQFGCWATTRRRLLDVGRCQGCGGWMAATL